MADFLHIYIYPKSGVTREQVEAKMNAAVDWFRYYANSYVVYTTSDADKWQSRLLDIVKPDGSLFICKIDVTKTQGWMTKQFWEWLRKKR